MTGWRALGAPAGARAAAVLRNGRGVAITVLENGAVQGIRTGEILVNQVLGGTLDGGLGNLYLRTRRRGGITWSALTGPAGGSLHTDGTQVRWEGLLDALRWSCSLSVATDLDAWFWTVRVMNTGRRVASIDTVLAQDLGLAKEAVVRSSELYVSQYIDHTILPDDGLGHLICSRQNLDQAGAHPWLMQGCLAGSSGFLTDGVQFYGLEYRATDVPAALGRPTLPNRRYQYEVALPTLQSRPRGLAPGETAEITFFARYLADHPEASSAGDARHAREATTAYAGLSPVLDELPPVPRPVGLFDAPALFPSRDLSTAELERRFGPAGGWRHSERRDGRLLSFFHGRDAHVVLRTKELVVERPTGHILRSGRDTLPNDDILSVTTWMSGVFASQLAIGNTSFNALLSVCRNPLNVMKASGQRIFVRTGRGLELLGVPSAFEMDPMGARWIYDDGEQTIVVEGRVSDRDAVWSTEVTVERGGPLELVMTHDVVLGEGGETAAPPRIEEDRGRVRLTAAPGTPIARRYPRAAYFIVPRAPRDVYAIGGDGLLFADGVDRGAPCVVVRTNPVTSFALAITGSATSAAMAARRAGESARRPTSSARADRERPASSSSPGAALADGMVLGLVTGGAADGSARRWADALARLNDVMPWYVHDALIHYLAPHGLEQHSGAAWGLRDVCQGPAELLLATRHHGELRQLLKLVYGHQYRQSGDWPQWFMYDRYRAVQEHESHGDIVHWPLKALGDYVHATGDLSILGERVGYTDEETFAPTGRRETLLRHVQRQLARIEATLVPGTALMAYGHGDWEDTLQPADPALAERLVSSWTVELAYQALDGFRAVCERAGEATLARHLGAWCGRIVADFNRYLVRDGVTAGLAYFGPDGVEHLLHPRDGRTGVSYRLLPMTRGIIGGVFTPRQARRHLALIDRHLAFPDGVRLMNRPMPYRGGVERYFRRAESAANFGREIGLQYVHAHIRYVEAMARVGRADAAFAGLLAVCPVGLEQSVPSAVPRQANAYFSSSDADFADRYEASRRFRRVRTGEVGVKGGWRIYSSGPGIYLNQLISNVLGLRDAFDDVLLDPVLPRGLDGLTFDFEYEGRPVRYRYRVEGQGFSPSDVRVNGQVMPGGRYSDNPYRSGGLLIPRDRFVAALSPDGNLVEVRV